jgi:1-acyl-sn-glycerol-3-phosphate acyltransferase
MKTWIAERILRAAGWRVVGQTPDVPKYVIIAAPHTSNWDLFYSLLLAAYFRINLNWIGKHTLFRWPFGIFLKWLGGIPVDRRGRHNFVDQVALVFKSRDRMALLITPEGTRKKAPYWKSGFYYIALGAQVPIVLGFVDFASKTAGIGPIIRPSGDIEEDMQLLRGFYSPMRGKYPDAMGEVRIRPADVVD